MEKVNVKEFRELNVSHNCLSLLPQEVRNLSTLISIDLSFNYVKSLPNLSGMPNLEIFNASHNEIDEFPIFSGCRKLTLLDLGHNNLSELIVGHLTECPIKLLSLYENNLRQLPQDINRLKTLFNLDVHGNRIKELPYQIALIRNLTVLNLDGNPISNVDEDSLESVELTLNFLMKELLKYTRINDENLLTKRNINLKSRLFGTEDNVGNEEHVPEKSLVFDSGFENSTGRKMRRIDLSNKNITYLPAELRMLKETLQELILRENRLKSLPDFVAQLENLRYLDLSNNNLDDLPENLKYVKIAVLIAANNCFKDIPTSVYAMKEMRRLDFSGNNITEIDVPRLKLLPCLKTLQLANNLIEHLPLSLPSLTNLKRLSLSGNPIAFPEQSVLDDGAEAIMTCLRKKQIEEKDNASWVTSHNSSR